MYLKVVAKWSHDSYYIAKLYLALSIMLQYKKQMLFVLPKLVCLFISHVLFVDVYPIVNFFSIVSYKHMQKRKTDLSLYITIFGHTEISWNTHRYIHANNLLCKHIAIYLKDPCMHYSLWCIHVHVCNYVVTKLTSVYTQ